MNKHTPNDLLLESLKAINESYMEGMKQASSQRPCSCEINRELLEACKAAFIELKERGHACPSYNKGPIQGCFVCCLGQAITKAEGKEVT